MTQPPDSVRMPGDDGAGAAPPLRGACWRLCSPAERAGAIAVLQIRGDVAGAFRALGIRPVPVGVMRVRDLAGVDWGVIATVRDDLALCMPHGGPEILRQLARAFELAGVPLDPAEDPQTRFPEARSPFEAAQLQALAHAASPRAIDMLLTQPRLWAAHLGREPGLDDPDPDPARSARLNRLIVPPLVVAVGASNIGKSTLLNRLSGRAVAAVADEPGTTRDHIGSLVDLDGLIVRWVDTPGRRPGAPAVEREASEIAADLIPGAGMVLELGDHRQPPVGVGAPPSAAVVRVALRSDLGVAGWPHDAAVSVAQNRGIDELARLLRELLVPDADLAAATPWRFWT